MKKVFALTLAIFAAVFAFGQESSDSVKVYFKIGQSQFVPAFHGNGVSMDSFIETVRAAYEAQKLDKIIVRSYASPEGSESYNKRLAEKRCATITDILTQRYGISPDLIEARPDGVAWDELRRVVANTPEVPAQAEVLDIIDNTPIWVTDANGRQVSGRRRKLMNLQGGLPWRWMNEKLFPSLRNTLAIALYLRPEVAEEPTPADTVSAEPASQQLPQDSIKEAVDSVVATEVITEEIITVSEPAEEVTLPESSVGTDEITTPPHHIFALKTNLLEYGILLPNLEFEWLISKHWSVAVEGNWAGWGSYKHEKSYRITVLDAAGRYWIKPRASFHGMYVGLIGGGGWYDLENGTPGHYGWGVMTGLSFGYMWPINRTLSFDAEVGAGYMYTRYKDYEPIEGHHVYLRTKEMNYFGPIRLKFSLAWRFLEVNKPKRVNMAL